MKTIARLNKDGQTYELEVDESILNVRRDYLQVVVDNIDFQFNDSGDLTIAKINFSQMNLDEAENWQRIK